MPFSATFVRILNSSLWKHLIHFHCYLIPCQIIYDSRVLNSFRSSLFSILLIYSSASFINSRSFVSRSCNMARLAFSAICFLCRIPSGTPLIFTVPSDFFPFFPQLTESVTILSSSLPISFPISGFFSQIFYFFFHICILYQDHLVQWYRLLSSPLCFSF